MISRHQSAIEEITDIKAKIKKFPALLNPCIVNTPLVVNVNKLIHVKRGQGDGDTK